MTRKVNIFQHSSNTLSPQHLHLRNSFQLLPSFLPSNLPFFLPSFISSLFFHSSFTFLRFFLSSFLHSFPPRPLFRCTTEHLFSLFPSLKSFYTILLSPCSSSYVPSPYNTCTTFCFTPPISLPSSLSLLPNTLLSTSLTLILLSRIRRSLFYIPHPRSLFPLFIV